MNRSANDYSRISAASSRLGRRAWKLRGRELDLLLLAGCSCLITTLSHPVAEALQAQAGHAAQRVVATQPQPSRSSPSFAIEAAVPTRRDDLQEEDS